MLGSKCYELVRFVDISPVLAILDHLPFEPANVGSTNPEKSPCFVVLPTRIPEPVATLVAGLGLSGFTRRILIRKLGPRQGMAPHVDRWMKGEADWRRYQLPIVTHPDIRMRWPDDGVEAHLAAGGLYEVDFSRLHEVVNHADVERVHVQIDQAG